MSKRCRHNLDLNLNGRVPQTLTSVVSPFIRPSTSLCSKTNVSNLWNQSGVDLDQDQEFESKYP